MVSTLTVSCDWSIIQCKMNVLPSHRQDVHEEMFHLSGLRHGAAHRKPGSANSRGEASSRPGDAEADPSVLLQLPLWWPGGGDGPGGHRGTVRRRGAGRRGRRRRRRRASWSSCSSGYLLGVHGAWSFTDWMLMICE